MPGIPGSGSGDGITGSLGAGSVVGRGPGPGCGSGAGGFSGGAGGSGGSGASGVSGGIGGPGRIEDSNGGAPAAPRRAGLIAVVAMARPNPLHLDAGCVSHSSSPSAHGVRLSPLGRSARRPGPSANRLAVFPRSIVDGVAVSEITPEVVRHLAGLARIALTEEEVARFTGELSHIVDAVAKVNEVATPDVPATSHPIPLANVFRPDVVGETLDRAAVLAGAPEHDGSRFRVSAILGEEQ